MFIVHELHCDHIKVAFVFTVRTHQGVGGILFENDALFTHRSIESDTSLYRHGFPTQYSAPYMRSGFWMVSYLQNS